MATAQMSMVIRHLHRAMMLQDGAGRPDGELLASFIDQKDETAFEALMRRHGPMVLAVCRRVVRNHHDADDAFQATFLVLARRASSVRPRAMVANWLHGVAYRTALKARTITTKRQVREKQVMEMPEPEATAQEQWHDLQPLIDQELHGLPENYRLPILLCDLEGKTIKEATGQLGWPQGTLAGRLARGRKLLAKRLANRGVVLSGGLLAAMVSQNVASAGVPTSLMISTAKAATKIAAGQATIFGVVSAKVAALTEGVLKTMLLTKLKVAIMVLFAALGTITLGGWLLNNGTATAQQAKSPEDTDGADQRLRVENVPGTQVQRQSVTFQESKESPKTEKPKKALSSPPPVFATIVDVQKGGEVTLREIISGPAIGEMLVAHGAVQMPSSTQIKQAQYLIRAKEWQVFTVGGTKISDNEVIAQLSKVDGMVLISVEEKLPDLAYLRLFTNDTLILVAPKVVARRTQSPKADSPTPPPAKKVLPKPTSKNKIAGGWHVVEIAGDGKAVPQDKLDKSQATITERRISVQLPKAPNGGFDFDLAYKLVTDGLITDGIDILPWDQREPWMDPCLGVFELKGDTLRIAFDNRSNGQRPRLPEADKDLTYIVLKRIKN